MRLPEEFFEPVADRLRILADVTRLRILDALRAGELTVLEIVGRVAASQPNVSRHLALLLRAGIVARRQEGRNVHYRLVDPFVDQICDAICGSVRAHVDRQAQRVRAARSAPSGRALATASTVPSTKRRRT